MVLRGHDRSVGGVGLSPDARRIATASDDGTVRIWDLTSKGNPLVLHGHGDQIYEVVFSPDGQRIASTGHDGTAGYGAQQKEHSWQYYAATTRR